MSKLTIEKVIERYARVIEEDNSGRHHNAHAYEEELMLDILKEIANPLNVPRPFALADTFLSAYNNHRKVLLERNPLARIY